MCFKTIKPENTAGRNRYEKYKIDCVSNKTTPTDDGFLTIIAREYYQFIGSTTRRFDPKTLIFGERYAMSRVPMNVLAEALPYIDVVSIQPNGCKFDKNTSQIYTKPPKNPLCYVIISAVSQPRITSTLCGSNWKVKPQLPTITMTMSMKL